MKLSDDKVVSKLKYRALNSFPFLSGLIGRTEVRLLDAVSMPNGSETIACCNKDMILISKKAVADMDFSDIYFIFMHEIMHMALLHVARYHEYLGKGIDRQMIMLYNIITDCKINELLDENGVYVSRDVGDGFVKACNVNDAIINAGFRKKDGVDSMISDFSDAINADDTDSDKAFILAREIYTFDKPPSGMAFNGNDIQDDNQSMKQNADLAKALTDDMKSKIIGGLMSNKLRGDSGGGMAKMFEDIYMSNKVNWSKVIRNSVAKGLRRDMDWSKPHKKSIANDFSVYLPSMEKKPKDYHVAVAIDTSGSMSDGEIRDILGELIGLQKHYPVVIDLYMCDYTIRKRILNIDKTYRLKKAARVYGGGGTSYTPVFRMISKMPRRSRYKTLIYFTDGYGNQDNIKAVRGLRTFWITDNGDASFPFGKKILLR